MSKLIFLDLATTGLEEKDSICELAFILETQDKVDCFATLCKGPKKISSSAMAVHHIRNEMVKDEKPCKDTKAYEKLLDLNTNENILISHNHNFDTKILEKEGFVSKFTVLDTLRCVRSLIPECDDFTLQYLRYELLLYKSENTLAKELDVQIQAHRAMSDALHTKLLYEALLEYATLSQLIEISSKPVLIAKLTFGKYAGSYIEEIATSDPSYLQWILNLEDVDEDLEYSIRMVI